MYRYLHRQQLEELGLEAKGSKVGSAGIIQANLFWTCGVFPFSFIAFSVHRLLDPSLRAESGQAFVT